MHETVAASRPNARAAQRVPGLILQVTPMQRHGGCLNRHGRGLEPLAGDSKATDGQGMRPPRAACPRSRPRGTTRRVEQRSMLCHLQVRAEATVRSTGLQTAKEAAKHLRYGSVLLQNRATRPRPPCLSAAPRMRSCRQIRTSCTAQSRLQAAAVELAAPSCSRGVASRSWSAGSKWAAPLPSAAPAP
jgi:hypothetical protein